MNCVRRDSTIVWTGIFLLSAIKGISQNADTLPSVTLQPVEVTAYRQKPVQETALNISTLDVDSLCRGGNFNLTDLIARTPGVNMLSTGPAIVKPVIRGLYGNRILVLLSGLKFDNQQWQEEHGLGLSDLGLSGVDLIKGPMSILYGTEAIGGIVNLLEEQPAKAHSHEHDIGLKLNSNTLGGLLQAGWKGSSGDKWWKIRMGIENHADYFDGNNDRVLNSRSDGYYLKAGYGFRRANWKSENNLMSSFNRFGFIFNDVYTFITPDARWSRDLGENPAHLVLLNILSSQNTFALHNGSVLSLNLGVQSNERMENEGGGAISLNMHLLTIQYLLKWEKQLSQKNRLILSNLGSFEDNTNFGARKIVPDAIMQESNVSAYLETTWHHNLILENGIGVGDKLIKTYFTASVNGPEKEVHPFSKFSFYYNAFTGMTWFPSGKFNIKFNAATGVRIPNLAELSSNGLHEGVFTYEIGDPDLKNEQNVALNLFVNWSTPDVEFSISPFYNYFFNYVYLAPTAEEWFGYPVFRYRQQNATQYGTEALVTIAPGSRLQTEVSYSGMISKTEDGNYTPFIPSQELSGTLRSTVSQRKEMTMHVSGTVEYHFSQDHTAPEEIATPDYWLWSLGGSATIQGNDRTYIIGLYGNNLLNTAYYDHLSRFKYFGLLNIGRNISLSVKIRFTRQTP